jgi:hypothetical protein
LALPSAVRARHWGAQPKLSANIRLMFQAMVTRLHSPRTRSSPRSRNWRNPITDLMMPNKQRGQHGASVVREQQSQEAISTFLPPRRHFPTPQVHRPNRPQNRTRRSDAHRLRRGRAWLGRLIRRAAQAMIHDERLPSAAPKQIGTIDDCDLDHLKGRTARACDLSFDESGPPYGKASLDDVGSDHDNRHQAPRGFAVSLIVAIILVVICLILLGDFLVDWLWFSAIGYLNVFWTIIIAEAEVFFSVLVATAIILWVNGWLASRFTRSPWIQRP